MSSDPSAREAQDMTWPAAKASSISIKHQGCCRCLATVRSRNIDEERCRKRLVPSDKVSECASVNAVTILMTGVSRRAHNTIAIRNAM
jgi:hypothetical protein